MIEQIENLSQLQQDIILFHTFVHGTEDDSVMLGNVNTPSLRNFIKTVRANITALSAVVTEFEDRLTEAEASLDTVKDALDTVQSNDTYTDGHDEYTAQVVGGLVQNGSSTSETATQSTEESSEANG